MKKPISLIVFLFIGYILISCSTNNNNNRPVKYVAYVGRYTDKNADKQPDNRFDRVHEYMLKSYIEELNSKNYAVELKLKTFDCKRDPKEAEKVYQEIAKDSTIVATIDNTWGVHLNGARSVIQSAAIPTVVINADHNHEDFGKQVVYTGNNDYLPMEINNFLSKVLKQKEILFISEADYALDKTFRATFLKNAITIRKEFTINYKASDKQKAFDSLVATIDEAFKSNPSLKNSWIVVNLHNEYGTKLIHYIDKNHTGVKMLGHAYIVQSIGNIKFGKLNQNELILINNPTDAVIRKIAIDLHQWKEQKSDLFLKTLSPMFPKRCYDAVSIIEGCLKQFGDSIIGRQQVGNYFQTLSKSVLRTDDELYYFNERNELIPDLYYVQYKDGRLYSYREQLNKKGNVIPNLIAGMEIVDLYNLDVSTNTFQADFFYWIKADSSNMDAERFILFPNMKESGSAKELVLEKTENGMVYKLYKVSGLFHQDYDLNNYPFDKQEISISMEVMNPAERLKIAFDQSAFVQDSNFLEKFKVKAWHKEKYLLTVDNRISSTMRGDPDSMEDELKKYQVFSFRLFVKRNIVGPLLEIIMPLMLIGLVAISLLFIKDLSFGNIGEVSAGTFLGIITFSIAMASLSPSTDYITRSDVLFWVTFSVVLICFMTIIIVNSIYSKGSEIRKLTFIKYMRLCLIVAYVISCSLILLI